jgi:exosortase/archaeosortase family protein
MTETVRALRTRFIVAGACWSAVLLAALHNPLVQRAVIAPYVAWQAVLARGSAGSSSVVVDLSCAGTDVIALSVAAILAYPISWGRRFGGLAGVTIWLMTLNALRIMTLFAVAGTPAFDVLHLYLWPALLILGAAGFVFVWIWTGDTIWDGRTDTVRRLVLVAPPVVAAYVVALPSLLRSFALQELATRAAVASAAILRLMGVDASTGGSTLVVASTALVITPECITTPLMPVFLACAFALPRRNSARLIAAVLFVPLFAILAVARLLTVALPPVLLSTPLYLTHGFHQLVLGVGCIAAAAFVVPASSGMPGPSTRVYMRAIGGTILFLLLLALLARPAQVSLDFLAEQVRRVLPHIRSTADPYDVQGAFAIMPAYEIALLVGLIAAAYVVLAPARIAMAVAALIVVQVLMLIAAGELTAHTGLEIPIAAARACAIATPVALFSALFTMTFRPFSPHGLDTPAGVQPTTV